MLSSIRQLPLEETYRRIIETSSDGVWLIDADHRTTFVNRRMADMLGYEPEEMLGKRFLDFKDADERTRSTERIGAGHPGQVGQIEGRLKRKDGGDVWTLLSTSVLHDEDGRFTGSLAMVTDITDRKAAEDQLRHAELRYRNLVEHIPGATYVAEPGKHGRWHYVSPQIETLIGYTPEEWVADPTLWAASVHPDDRERVFADEHPSHPLGELPSAEYRMRAKDGREVWVMDDGVAVEMPDGALVFEGVLFDITARKRAEQALSDSHALLAEAQALAHVGSWEWSGGTDEITWSDEMHRIFGLLPGEFAGSYSAFMAQVHPDDRDAVADVVRRARENHQAYSHEYRIVRPDGEIRLCHARARVVADEQGEVLSLFGTVQDVTDQRRAAQELQESRELLQAVLDASPSAIFVKDRDCRYLLANRRFELNVGLGEGEMVGRTDESVFEPAVVEVIRAQDRELLATGMPVANEHVLNLDDGPHVFLTQKSPLVDERGEVYGLCGVATDITPQMHAQEELRRRAERQAATTELGGQAIAGVPLPALFEEAVTIVGRLLDVEFAKILELHPDGGEPVLRAAVGVDSALVGKTTIAADADTHAGVSGISARIEGEQTAFGVITAHSRDDRRFGDEETTFLQSVANVLGWAVARDRAQRLEAQLQQSQRLESVGQLAGGIAHDFNNLLAVILNYARFAINRLPSDDPARADVEEAEKAAKRAADLTRQLLVFSRREVVSPEALDVNVVVRDMENMLRRTLGEHIDLQTRLDPSVRDVLIGPGQLEQILVNLAINARDAMPDGGTLEVSTQSLVLDAETSRGGFSIPAGEYVQLTVADSGTGMTPEVLEHAFEPFFTTKPKGHGTGLGLATVYGAVKQAGGYIDIGSEEGHGTAVSVFLPITAALRSGSPSAEDGDATVNGDRTVLLVEDEDGVRRLTERILREHGYRVISASDGEGAIRACRDGTPIDLLLTDVVMPGISGKELARHVERAHPDAKSLYMSGYPNDVIARRGVVDSGILLLEKPFSAGDLLKAVNEAFETSHAPVAPGRAPAERQKARSSQ